jgi:phosphoenolpyruvate carboxylase
MQPSKRLELFDKLVFNKFNIYNSLFLNLPYSKNSSLGLLIPILYEESRKGLEAGKQPLEILDSFFTNFVNAQTEQDKIDFIFKVIQYVERQVVLFDGVEDAAFEELHSLGNYLSISNFFQSLNGEANWKSVADKLSSFSARIVFTAHPTQFYPPDVLDIIRNLRSLISENKINEINQTLQQLGLTSLINSKKPTPFDEAKNIIYFLRNVYYHAVGELYTYIKSKVKGQDFHNTNIIKLGFWPGGDRDGNPFVTAEITAAVADELRMTLMKCYYHDVKYLQSKLTFRGIEEILQKLRSDLYIAMFDPAVLLPYEAITGPLEEVRHLLTSHYHNLYLDDLDLLLDKVHIFKTHFATLDIRQDHSVHHVTVKAILNNANISLEELTEAELLDILLHKELDALKYEYTDSLVVDTVRNIAQLKNIQKKNGQEGCNRYIISNSSSIFSVLYVYALFRWCGWKKEELSFDIVPLFETIDGMERSEAAMRKLFDIPEYRRHLQQRGDSQTIMVGFSDGTKDGGYLKANWSIFRTKEKLTAVCEAQGIKAIFFDGRGGPPSRGGGKTHRFYASQSPQIANNEIQLTVQGQTITSTYGTSEHFKHNCEQLITAGLSNSFSSEKNVLSEDSRALLQELADISFAKYESLKNHPQFLPYLENKSILRYYGKANIGSRPGKRGNKEKLELNDLRAISFVGSWSQLKQNVPGYYGIGTALKTLADRDRLKDLKKLFKASPFFRTLMMNSMMSLQKCNFNLTRHIQDDPEFGEFWNILHDEFVLSKEMLLLISDHNHLMEKEPVSRESIIIRERIVLPLLLVQQYALQKINLDSEYTELYEKIVTRSMYGNINASRNSA